MSYSVSITRNRDYPYDRRSGGVTLQEWLELVRDDVSLVPDDNEEGTFWWSDAETPFRYDSLRETIEYQNPTPEAINKLLELATKIDACVRGHNSEFYLSGSVVEWPDHPDFAEYAGDSRITAFIDRWATVMFIVVIAISVIAVDYAGGGFLISMLVSMASVVLLASVMFALENIDEERQRAKS